MRVCGWQRAQAQFGQGLGNVLEVGCGTAFLGTVVGPAYTGLDRELGMLRHRLDGTTVVAGDAGALPFRDGSFDVVVSTAFLGLLPPPARAEVLREMTRVCRREVRVLEPIAGVTRIAALTLSNSPLEMTEFAQAGLVARVGPPVYFGLYAPVVARPVFG